MLAVAADLLHELHNRRFFREEIIRLPDGQNIWVRQREVIRRRVLVQKEDQMISLGHRPDFGRVPFLDERDHARPDLFVMVVLIFVPWIKRLNGRPLQSGSIAPAGLQHVFHLQVKYAQLRLIIFRVRVLNARDLLNLGEDDDARASNDFGQRHLRDRDRRRDEALIRCD